MLSMTYIIDNPMTYVPAISVILLTAILICYKSRRKALPNVVVIFTRFPQAGTTKRRLIPELGENGASRAQLCMTESLIDKLDEKMYDKSIYYCGGSEVEMSYWLERRRQNKVITSWHAQSEGGLGQRLANAARETFEKGAKRVIILGSDIPDISNSHIAEVLTLLQDGDNCFQMVLGRAFDGGYYLVGLRHDTLSSLDELFHDIDWGTERVFNQQITVASSLGISYGVLAETLSDVDIPADIPVLEKEMGITKQQFLLPHLSLIIPTFNEENNIRKTLDTLLQNVNRQERLEIIVCDGRSTDRTLAIVDEFSKRTHFPVKTIVTDAGRGKQLREGVSASNGDTLLFLHSDSLLPVDFDMDIDYTLDRPGNVAGAFAFDLDVLHSEIIPSQQVTSSMMFQMKLLRWGTQLRSERYELPYGDQGVFMRRRVYDVVGGFDNVPLMEDYMLVSKLKRLGHVYVIPDKAIITTARRWIKHGYLKVTLFNQLILTAYHIGVSPETLYQWYYGKTT